MEDNPIINEITGLATSQVMKVIIAKVPLLGVGFWGYVAYRIVLKVVSLVVKYSDLGLAFVMIEKEKHADVQEFKDASKKLEEAKAAGDEEQIKKAEQEAIDRFRDLIRFKRAG